MEVDDSRRRRGRPKKRWIDGGKGYGGGKGDEGRSGGPWGMEEEDPDSQPQHSLGLRWKIKKKVQDTVALP